MQDIVQIPKLKYSIEGQLRESKEFAERKGITIFGTYIDRALSAKTDNRPQFQKMIRDSAKGLFDVIIVWKLDRFARNRYDSAHYKAILRKNGVKVISATEPISEDATGILLESLLEGYAEFYSAELSEKVKRGLCVTAKKRKGCNKKSAQKDWIEEIVINQALTMLANDDILNKIADMVLDLQKQENIVLPMLQKQLAEIEKGIENMLNAIQSGVLTSSTKKRLDELETSKAEIEVKILQEEMQKPRLTKEQILFWLHKFRGIDISKREHRQRLIDTFINAVYLYDDKIVLTFNFKDGSKTVTMGDVEESYGSDLTTSSA